MTHRHGVQRWHRTDILKVALYPLSWGRVCVGAGLRVCEAGPVWSRVCEAGSVWSRVCKTGPVWTRVFRAGPV